MKWTKKKIAFNVLQLVFYGVIPLALIFLTYGSMGHSVQAVGFKIAAPGIALIVIVFLCFKKLVISKKLSDAHDRLNNHKASLEVKTDEREVENIENTIKNLGTAEVLLNSVVPLLLTALGVVTCKVLESQLVTLSGTLGFILLSFTAGTVFAVLDAREVKSRHREKNNEREEG